MRIWSRVAVALLLSLIVAPFNAPASQAYDPPLVLWSGDSGAGFLVNAAVLNRTEGGYRYIAGKQNTHLTITQLADGRLQFVDTGTQDLREIPRTCVRKAVPQGVAAVCTIPAAFADTDMYLEVWPRLGNDFVSTSSLPAKFRTYALVDWGSDTVWLGAGDDFVNGAKGNDRIHGGGGDDWIRTGPGDDRIQGEDGNDKLVGVEDDDTIDGGAGDDDVFGGPGADTLSGGDGRDVLGCNDGRDTVLADLLDRLSGCELVSWL